MKLTKKQGKIVASAIHTWVGENVLSRDQGERLLESFEITAFDWRRLAKYSFWVSICCIIIAVGAVIADDYLIALIAELFNAPAIAKCPGSASMATLFYYCGIRRKYKKPEKIFSNEAIFFLGVLATAASIAFFGEAMDTGSGHFSMLILIAAMVYGIKADDGMTRGFGITFLFINLYTRFFEHFWNNMHKAIIFGLLAASFWYIGTHAEKIWNVSFIPPPKKPDRPKLPTDGG